MRSWKEKVVRNVTSMAAGTGVSKLGIFNPEQLNATLDNACPWSRQEPGEENLLGGPRLASSGGSERATTRSWLGWLYGPPSRAQDKPRDHSKATGDPHRARGSAHTSWDERWILLHVLATGIQDRSGGPWALRANGLNLCASASHKIIIFPSLLRFSQVSGTAPVPPGNPFHDKLASCTNPGCAKLVQLSQDFFF